MENTEPSNNNTFSFIHTADLHLDSPFTGITKIDPKIGKKLVRSTFQAYETIIDLCIDKKVDFLLIAGDIYNSADKSLYAQLTFISGLKKLSNAGISTYIAHGNHDPLNGWSATLKWPENVFIMSGDCVNTFSYKKNQTIVARIAGISYTHQHITSNLTENFPHKEEDDPFTIGLLHCTIGSNTGHEPYAPCTIQDLKDLNYDYLALGHIHTTSIVNDSDPVIIYPGNPQGRNPGETGPKGCYLVRVDQNRSISTEFIETDNIRWFTEEISIEEIPTEQELLDKIIDHTESITANANERFLMCRYILTGRGALHTTLAKEGVLDDIIKYLREEEISGSVWIEQLVDNSRRFIDRNMLLNRNDFIGDIVRLVDELSENVGSLESIEKSLEPLFTSARAKKLLKKIDHEELPDLINQAEDMLLNRIIIEDEHEY
ncbi:MAG: DNA repair exonuclease [Methanosarcinales archaeon]|nr:DNA repair exonuclease [Methanosarcinales archaeon]